MTGSVQNASHVEPIIDRASELHALPIVVFEAQQLIADSNTSAKDLAELLSKDPAIASRILKMANSSFYGFQKKIGNLAQAIVVLGFQQLKNLTVTVGVIDSFRTGSDDDYDYPSFWAHSVATAIAADHVARKVKVAKVEEAYMAGLFHDIGKLVLAQHLPSLYSEVRQAVTEGRHSLELEREILGRDHADLGARFLSHWDLPDSLVAAVENHHAACTAEGEVTLAEVVQLADVIVNALGLSATASALPEVMERLGERLGYDDATLAEWIEGIATGLENASEFFELVGYGPVTF
ncbi:MAG: HDOD domain-containing protein [Planctomycetota bacterium]